MPASSPIDHGWRRMIRMVEFENGVRWIARLCILPLEIAGLGEDLNDLYNNQSDDAKGNQ